MSNQITYIVKVVDAATRNLRRIATATKGMVRGMAGASGALRKLGYQFTSLRSIISATYGAMIVAFPIKKAIDFEEQLINIKRVAKFGSEDEFKNFREGLIKTSIRLGIIPKEMGEIGYEVAKFINDPKLIKGYTELAAKVSRSFDIPGKEAAEQIGKISAKMGLNLNEMEQFLDAVNYAADRSATSVKNQLQIIARVSTKMVDMRLPPELAAGWANFADRLHATPRIAAKGLEMFFRAISRMKGGYKALYKPGADTNKIFVDFLRKLKSMPEVLRRMRLDKTFDVRVIEFINKAVRQFDKLEESLGFVANKSKFVGSMLKELNIKLTSSRTAIDRIRAVWHAVAITIGNAFLPLIKELTPIIVKMALSFREFVKEHPRLTKIVMVAIALLTALSFVTIFIGLLVVALGGLISIPSLIIIGIIGIGASIAYVWYKSEGLRNSFGRLAEPFKKIGRSISNIFSMLFGGIDGSKVFGGVFSFFEFSAIGIINSLALAFETMLAPIILMLNLLESIIGFFVNIETYVTKFSDFAGGIAESIGSGISEFGHAYSLVSEARTGYVSSKVNQSVMNGRIEVSALKGSEIRQVTLDDKPSGNLGMYMHDRGGF